MGHIDGSPNCEMQLKQGHRQLCLRLPAFRHARFAPCWLELPGRDFAQRFATCEAPESVLNFKNPLRGADCHDNLNSKWKDGLCIRADVMRHCKRARKADRLPCRHLDAPYSAWKQVCASESRAGFICAVGCGHGKLPCGKCVAFEIYESRQ